MAKSCCHGFAADWKHASDSRIASDDVLKHDRKQCISHCVWSPEGGSNKQPNLQLKTKNRATVKEIRYFGSAVDNIKEAYPRRLHPDLKRNSEMINRGSLRQIT